ncbi:hypothetical protein B0H16DRAFT_1731503 [Mycena metata]|uniref:Uncharacterized protein n=1 Tax=Mycena metata TaxID=1033252 RepID=A0AAD7I6A3_9AGAR|nr:hypothetical protein B0H16DRAFT_1731503 [Mycena metata]
MQEGWSKGRTSELRDLLSKTQGVAESIQIKRRPPRLRLRGGRAGTGADEATAATPTRASTPLKRAASTHFLPLLLLHKKPSDLQSYNEKRMNTHHAQPRSPPESYSHSYSHSQGAHTHPPPHSHSSASPPHSAPSPSCLPRARKRLGMRQGRASPEDEAEPGQWKWQLGVVFAVVVELGAAPVLVVLDRLDVDVVRTQGEAVDEDGYEAVKSASIL